MCHSARALPILAGRGAGLGGDIPNLLCWKLASGSLARGLHRSYGGLGRGRLPDTREATCHDGPLAPTAAAPAQGLLLFLKKVGLALGGASARTAALGRLLNVAVADVAQFL